MEREDAIYWLNVLKMHSEKRDAQLLTEALNIAIEALSDRKIENNSEKPNNCKYAENPSGDVWECGCFLDTYCEHQIYDRNPDGTINIVECGYEPKDEPQTEYCGTCRFEDYSSSKEPCNSCLVSGSNWQPKGEPQKHCHRPNNVACHPEQGDIWCRGCDYWYANEPQTERGSE